MSLRNSFIVIIIVLILIGKNAIAFEDQVTHPAITEMAILLPTSELTKYIQDNLGYADGIDLVVNGLSVRKWLRQGSIDEDSPLCRASNHFHNPLKPWDQSGASDFPPQNWACNLQSWPTYSAVTWATGYISPAPNGDKVTFAQNASTAPNNWDSARNYFYQAMKAETVASREYNFAMSLHALGQVIHLLEDMAVPAHTRNDFWSHLFLQYGGSTLSNWVYQPFERYVFRNTEALVRDAAVKVTSNPNDYSPSFTDQSVTKFWDTTQYRSSGIPSASTNIGLAEYSNANYLSDYTIPNNWLTNLWSHSFPFPKVENTSYEICEEALNVLGMKRRYVSRKGRSGTICDHYATLPLYASFARSTAYLNNNISTVRLELDDKVHNTYAQDLLPRAIGFASGLVNYFFRGKLIVGPPTENVYAITDGSKTYPFDSTYFDSGNPPQQLSATTQQQQFTRIKAKVTNTTPSEDMKDGTLVVVAEYKVIPNYQPDLSNYDTTPPPGTNPPPAPNPNRPTATMMDNVPFSYSVSTPAVLAAPLAATAARDFEFNFPPEQPIPVGITDLSMYVVFKGTLGNEKDNAIAVAWQPLFEPVHQTFWNLTDRFSLYDNLRTEADIINNPTWRAQVDWNRNGITSEPNEPYIKPYPMSFEIGYAAKNPPDPGQTVTTLATVTDVQPGGYIRLITLVSEPTNYVKFKSTNALVQNTTEFVDTFYGTVCNGYESAFTCEKKETLRNVRYDYHSGLLRCEPFSSDASGRTYCYYPDPGTAIPNFGPLPVNINFGTSAP